MILSLDIVFYILIPVLAAGLMMTVAILGYRSRKKTEKLLKLTIDNLVLKDSLDKLVREQESKKIEESDGFIKFLSDSREWAFGYIENVQNVISEFVAKAGPQIKYLNTYGSVAPSPLDDNIRVISDAYYQLEKVLPKDDLGYNN